MLSRFIRSSQRSGYAYHHNPARMVALNQVLSRARRRYDRLSLSNHDFVRLVSQPDNAFFIRNNFCAGISERPETCLLLALYRNNNSYSTRSALNSQKLFDHAADGGSLNGRKAWPQRFEHIERTLDRLRQQSSAERPAFFL